MTWQTGAIGDVEECPQNEHGVVTNRHRVATNCETTHSLVMRTSAAMYSRNGIGLPDNSRASPRLLALMCLSRHFAIWVLNNLPVEPHRW